MTSAHGPASLVGKTTAHPGRAWRRAAEARAERWLGPVVKRSLYVLAFDVVARDVTTAVPSSPCHPGLVLRRIARDEAPWWEQTLKRKEANRIRAGVADGDIGHVVLMGDRIVGEVWATRRTKGDIRLGLAANEACAYGLRTDKRYRQLGTASTVMSGLLEELRRDETVAVVYGWIDERNRPCQVLLRTRFGFRQVQRARRVRALQRWGFVVPGSAVPPEGPLLLPFSSLMALSP